MNTLRHTTRPGLTSEGSRGRTLLRLPLNYFLGHPVALRSQAHCPPHRPRGTTQAITQNRAWSSTPVTTLHSVPSVSIRPPTMSSCHSAIGVWRSQRRYSRRLPRRRPGSIRPGRGRMRCTVDFPGDMLPSAVLAASSWAMRRGPQRGCSHTRVSASAEAWWEHAGAGETGLSTRPGHPGHTGSTRYAGFGATPRTGPPPRSWVHRARRPARHGSAAQQQTTRPEPILTPHHHPHRTAIGKSIRPHIKRHLGPACQESAGTTQ